MSASVHEQRSYPAAEALPLAGIFAASLSFLIFMTVCLFSFIIDLWRLYTSDFTFCICHCIKTGESLSSILFPPDTSDRT